ncbi:MAG: 4-hydroxy-tetrahydrodipicolinate synthase [Prolixibacteraceae bacterium]|nr:4-hydroxy-tetrahydrodipicolinate synthase [Prolixibacteraceae bacterium]
MSLEFSGAGVALITPFNENNAIDYDTLGQIVDNQLSNGMDYLVALGTTGETPALTKNEKLNIVRSVVERADGKVPVVVGIGGNNTQNVIKSIKNADLTGVDGLLIVTPYYNKPSQEGLYNHYKAISEESPLPIILYNVPSRTGVNMEAETVIRLAEDFKNIVAVKEASGILSQLSTIEKYTSDDFLLISGDDVLAVPILSIGGKGIISVIANAYPEKLSRLIHLGMEGNFAEAQKIHMELIDMFKLIFKEGSPGGVKALMEILGMCKNMLRSPLAPVSEKLYLEIKEAARLIK